MLTSPRKLLQRHQQSVSGSATFRLAMLHLKTHTHTS